MNISERRSSCDQKLRETETGNKVKKIRKKLGTVRAPLGFYFTV